MTLVVDQPRSAPGARGLLGGAPAGARAGGLASRGPRPVRHAAPRRGLGLFGAPRGAARRARGGARRAVGGAARASAARAVRERACVRGAAGAGKSRLARWLCERAHEVGAAPAPDVDALRATAAGRRRRPRRSRRAPALPDADAGDLEQAVDTLGIHRPRSPDAGPLPRPRARIPWMPPGERRYLFRRALAALARRPPARPVARRRAVGPSSLALAREVLAGDAPILVLAHACATRRWRSARSRRRSCPTGPRGEQVASARSIASPTRSSSRAGCSGSTRAVGAVAARTAGNPLFAVELVGDWVERGLLESGPQGLRAPDGEVPELPADLTAVWRPRLAAPSAGCRPGRLPSVEAAAVLGMRFDPAEWTELCVAARLPADPAVLDTLLDQRLLLPEPGGRRGSCSRTGCSARPSSPRPPGAGRRRDARRAAAVRPRRPDRPIGLARYGTHALDAGAPGDAAGALERALEQGGRLGPGLVRSGSTRSAARSTPSGCRRRTRARSGTWCSGPGSSACTATRSEGSRCSRGPSRAAAGARRPRARSSRPSASAASSHDPRAGGGGGGRLRRRRVPRPRPRAAGRGPAHAHHLGNVLLVLRRRPRTRAGASSRRAPSPTCRRSGWPSSSSRSASARSRGGRAGRGRGHFRTSREGFRAEEYAWGQWPRRRHARRRRAGPRRHAAPRGRSTSSPASLRAERRRADATVFIGHEPRARSTSRGRPAEADALLGAPRRTSSSGAGGQEPGTWRCAGGGCGAARAAELGAWDCSTPAWPRWRRSPRGRTRRPPTKRSGGGGAGVRDAGEADCADRAFRAAIAMFERLDHPTSAEEARHAAAGS